MTKTSITDTELAEIGTEPFIQSEHEAIRRYCERIAGVPDCFDLVDEQGVDNFPDEFTHDDKTKLIKDHFVMLGDWREAITSLSEDLADAAGNTIPSISWPPPMSDAATRYVGAELLEWHKVLEGWRWGTIEFFLGRDKHGYRFDTFAPRPEDCRHADGAFWING